LLADSGPVGAAAVEAGASSSCEGGEASNSPAPAAATPAPAPGIDIWTYTDAHNREWGAVGVNRTQAASWLQFELGCAPAAISEAGADPSSDPPPAAAATSRSASRGAGSEDVWAQLTESSLPLSQRCTHRRLRRLWRDSRLLLYGVSLTDLLEQGAGTKPERTFRRYFCGLDDLHRTVIL